MEQAFQEAILHDWLACTAFGSANPLFFFALCARRSERPEAANLFRFLTAQPLTGDRALVLKAWRDNPFFDQGASDLKIQEPRHVFPVFLPYYGVGMVVPLLVQPSEDWSPSDAFGTFEFDGSVNTAADGLMNLLRLLEDTWLRRSGRTAIPLRWRRAFALSIGCPVHFRAIEGRSLQVPLLIALLRELCTQPFSSNGAARVPFGNQSIFATGTLQSGGIFGKVASLEEKLEAFVRESSGARTAILTGDQMRELERTDNGTRLLARINPLRADNISDLLDIDAFQPGLEAIAGPPHLTEVDALLAQMERLARSVRFRETSSIATWLLPHVKSPPYRLRLLVRAGMSLVHQGRYLDAEQYLGNAQQLLTHSPPELGVDDRARAAAALASQMFDQAAPEKGLELLETVTSQLEFCTAANRVRVLGQRCQLLRFLRRWDEAVKAGEEAVHLAKQGLASEAGMDMNFLIHTLLRRAAAHPSSCKADLHWAEELLEQSRTAWAPADSRSARESHLGFCQHYEAEVARLRRTPYDPGETPPCIGVWAHPRMFALLACARNRAHDFSQRLQYARILRRTAAEFRERYCGLFEMFYLVYDSYLAYLEGKPTGQNTQLLTLWYNDQAAKGAPGWRRLLEPTVTCAPPSYNEGWVEELCDVIPYH